MHAQIIETSQPLLPWRCQRWWRRGHRTPPFRKRVDVSSRTALCGRGRDTQHRQPDASPPTRARSRARDGHPLNK